MKKLLCILLALLLLTGCGGPAADETTIPEPTETEPPIPWIEEVGKPWDQEGVLTELPLTIPDGVHYDTVQEFDGDLLLWDIDNHLENVYTLEMCLIELDDGTVAGENEISFSDWVFPQILGDQMYLCDNAAGKVFQLNKQLDVVKTWDMEPMEGSYTVGANEILYIYDWNGSVKTQDLNTGETRPLLEGDPYIDFFNIFGENVSIEYYSADTGAEMMAVLDLTTGQVLHAPIRGRFTSVNYSDGVWFCDIYDDSVTVFVGTNEFDFVQADIGNGNLQFADGNKLLLNHEDGCSVSLHELDGTAIAKATICTAPYNYGCFAVIPSEVYGGYFMVISDYSTSYRLLYWDITNSGAGEDILFEPVPAPDEMEAAVRQRVDALQIEYGLNILVGQDCDTYFYDFEVEPVTDWMLISDALDILEDALEDYPEDFFLQLRYGDVQSVVIQLVGTLTATNSQYTDSYTAFVQDEYSSQVMVVDIQIAEEQTYYHEFSHIIDSYLAWDAMNRQDALFSEEAWNALNPDWFPGYTYDYSWQQYVEDYSCFVDSYSTIKPTEDRARVLEYAMVDYGYYTFEGSDTLMEKLSYYCRCIRDAFDTTGWPETVLWEQYLQ